jgi:hypothetical protein
VSVTVSPGYGFASADMVAVLEYKAIPTTMPSDKDDKTHSASQEKAAAKPNPQTRRLVASTFTPKGDNAAVFTFISPKSLNETVVPEGVTLELWRRQRPDEIAEVSTANASDQPAYQIFPCVYARNPSSKEPGFKMFVRAGVINAIGGTGSVMVNFPTVAPDSEVTLSVSGADISGVQSDPSDMVRKDPTGLTITKAGAVTLTFINLNPQKPVVISATDKSTVVGPLILSVGQVTGGGGGGSAKPPAASQPQPNKTKE